MLWKWRYVLDLMLWGLLPPARVGFVFAFQSVMRLCVLRVRSANRGTPTIKSFHYSRPAQFSRDYADASPTLPSIRKVRLLLPLVKRL